MEQYSAPQKMRKLGDLFDKYKTRFKAPQATVEKACAAAILKVTGFTITAECISYTVATKTISLAVPSLLKSELKLRQVEILKELQDSLGKNEAPKIIF